MIGGDFDSLNRVKSDLLDSSLRARAAAVSYPKPESDPDDLLAEEGVLLVEPEEDDDGGGGDDENFVPVPAE